MKLQGFLFFGTANGVLENVRRRAGITLPQPLRYLILDFRQVHGLDSSATLSFVKMAQLARRSGFTIVTSQCSPVLFRQLSRGGFDPQADTHLHSVADLQHALEWCEDDLLRHAEQAGALGPPAPLWAHLDAPLQGLGGTEHFLKTYLERVNAPAGTELMRQGDESEDLYFIESGRLKVELVHGPGPPVHIRTLGPGTVVGEVAWYLGIRRSASVTTIQPTTLYRLSSDSLGRLKAEAPQVAAVFHEFMCQMLAERLVNTNKLLEQVLD